MRPPTDHDAVAGFVLTERALRRPAADRGRCAIRCRPRVLANPPEHKWTVAETPGAAVSRSILDERFRRRWLFADPPPPERRMHSPRSLHDDRSERGHVVRRAGC
jgi:hypothetical protein